MAPVASARTASPVMVGRQEELRTLEAFLGDLTRGQGGSVLVSGRAGMGKTRLIAEAGRRWRADGARVLVGGCLPAAPPYAALASALRTAIPSSAPATRMLSGERPVTRLELFETLRTSLTGLATRSPVVLVVEDLHWSDRATRDALGFLVHEADHGRWGLVATHRHEGPLPERELVAFADVLDRRPLRRVPLTPLSPAAVAEQVAAITGTTPSSEEADSLHRRSGGIPLLVEEVLAARDSRVPDHLRSTFRARVERQGPTVQAALRVVAVAERCDELIVADAAGGTVDDVSDALRRARGADLVTVDEVGYRFHHDLLREAVYDDIPPGHRRELHRLVAEALAARPDQDPAVLAGHWRRAGIPAREVPIALAAAERAERLHAPGSAHQYLERVLQLRPALAERDREECGVHDELLRRAALAAERSGAYNRAAALTEERLALAADGPAEQALRWERLARYRWEAGDGHGSRAAYKEAVRVLPRDAAPAVRAQVLSGLAWHLAATFQYDEARTVADEAMEAGESVPDALVRWQVHLAWGIGRLGTDAGHQALEEACQLATAVGEGDRIVVARMWLNFSIQQLGHTDAREPNLRIGLRVAAAAGLERSMSAALRYLLAELLLETGRWDEAEEQLRHNQRLRVTGIPAFFTWGFQARLAAWRGEATTHRAALERTRELADDAPQQPLPLSTALTGHAETLLWAAEPVGALAVAKEALRLGAVDPFVGGEALMVVCRAAADVAQQAALHGDEFDPGEIPDLMARIGQIDGAEGPRLRAQAALCHAELSRAGAGGGSRSDVEEAWRTAVSAWTAAEDPYPEAYARWRLAQVLLTDRSGRGEAANLLTRVHEVAVSLGARPLLGAVDAVARRGRVRLGDIDREPVADGPAVALTAREADVLPFLAAGRTNAEIADVLVISPRTVGVHVSRILHKLGAARRAEVAERARRAGLLGD